MEERGRSRGWWRGGWGKLKGPGGGRGLVEHLRRRREGDWGTYRTWFSGREDGADEESGEILEGTYHACLCLRE